MTPESSDVVVTLVTNRIHREMVTSYVRLLKESVFSNEPLNIDRKTLMACQRKLRSEDALAILEILWKESSWVSEENLKAAGLERYFNKSEITQYGLAVALSYRTEDVAKTNSSVRSVALAAAAFGLIDRNKQTQKKIYLRATNKLHKFMIELGKRNQNLLEQYK